MRLGRAARQMSELRGARLALAWRLLVMPICLLRFINFATFPMFKWGEDLTCKFVREYRRRGCLWDVRSPHYKSKVARTMAYESLISAMDIPGLSFADVKNKIKNLRSTFNQEVKKIKSSLKSEGASGERVVYRPSLKWFDDMEVVLSCAAASVDSPNGIKSRSSTGIEDEVVDDGVYQCSPQDQESPWKLDLAVQQPLQEEREPVVQHLWHPENSHQKDANSTSRKRPSGEASHQEEYISQDPLAKKLQRTNKEAAFIMALKTISRMRDDHQVFGDFVASSIRSMRSEKIRRKLKLEIQRAVLEASVLDESEKSSSHS